MFKKDPTQVNRLDKHGRTPLHVAAHRGAVLVAEVICEFHPDLFANDEQGLTPAHLAAEFSQPVTAGFLFEQALGQEDISEPSWIPAPEVRRRFDAFIATNPRPDQDTISSFVGELTGLDTDELNDSINIVKNYTHLKGLDGDILAASAEGWWSESFFPQRIRAMVLALSEVDAIPVRARGGQSVEEIRAALCSEISVLLETLRTARRLSSLEGEKPELIGLATRLQAKQLTERVVEQSLGEETYLPLGFPGHAMYMGLKTVDVDVASPVGDDPTSERCILVRIDNLGAGHTKAHEEDRKTGKVQSRSFNVPLSFLDNPEDQQRFEQFLQRILACEVSEDTAAEDFYGHVAELKRTLKAKASPDLIEDRTQLSEHDAETPQRVGNCSVENTHRGLHERLQNEEFYKWFRLHERKVAGELVDTYAQTSMLLQAAERKRDQAIIEKLLEKPDGNTLAKLHAMFTDPLESDNRQDLAECLSVENVLPLVKAADDQSLRLLLEHGLTADLQGEKDITLLHVAATAGKADLVRVLLDFVTHIDDPDAAGCTPLFRAAKGGHGEVIKLLRARGADKGKANKEGVTPEQIVRAKQKAAVRAHKAMGGAA